MDGTDTIGIEQALSLVNKLGDLAEPAKKKLEDLLQSLHLAGEKTINFGSIAQSAGNIAAEALHKAAEAVHELFQYFPALEAEAKELSGVMKGFFAEAAEAAHSAGLAGSDIALAFEPVIGVIDKSITGMGKLGDTGYEAGSKISTAFKSVEPLITKAFGTDSGITKFFTAMADGASQAVGLEREILAMSVAQGRASDVFDVTTHKLKDVNELYEDFVNSSIQAAMATNQTVGSMMDLQKALSAIPGSLDSATETVQASQLAAAAGRDQLKVAEQLSEMYTKLGTTEKDALTTLGYIHEKAGDSKLRMEAFNQTVMTVAGSFKMLGDNTVATTNFVSAFDKAFQDSKISPEAMKEVITSIGQGVQQMDVAKKAFVSATTGGPGGLAGAIQMDYAIQEGHADQVIRKTMLAMQSQFGGQVVTLKDAAQNPALAGEFYKQIQYLTQVAGIAKDEDQAKRILEAMKTGVMDYLKPGAGELEKDTAMSRQLARGADIQEQTRNIFMSTHQTMEAMRLRQNEIYQKMVQWDPHIEQMVSGLAKKAGLTIGPTRKMGTEGPRHAGVRMLAHGGAGEAGPGAYAPPTWPEMLGGPLGIEDVFEKTNKAVSGAVNRMTATERGRTREDYVSMMPSRGGPPPETEAGMISSRRGPPPGTEAGITPVMRGHRPDLGLPETPKLTLPTAREGLGTAPGLGLPTMNITHTFKPIQLDISGIGDTVISRHVDLALVKSESNRVDQQVTGRPGGQ